MPPSNLLAKTMMDYERQTATVSRQGHASIDSDEDSRTSQTRMTRKQIRIEKVGERLPKSKRIVSCSKILCSSVVLALIRTAGSKTLISSIL